MRKYKLTPVDKVTEVQMASLHVIAYVYILVRKNVVGWKVWTIDSATEWNSGKMTGASLLGFVSWYSKYFLYNVI